MWWAKRVVVSRVAAALALEEMRRRSEEKMIKHETFEVSGVAIYCDRCNKRGPDEAYDNSAAVIDEAERDGWRADGEVDVCAACLKLAEAEAEARLNAAEAKVKTKGKKR